ncbi:hypothetical protein HOD53_01120 [Candidatus Woesearchaeota archaeon]|nr:hypothetical protein [Candidatus Woesearchaeota archaeon]
MKKLFLFFLILIVISSCTYTKDTQSSPKTPKDIVVDISDYRAESYKGEGKWDGDPDPPYGYPKNMPDYLNWGDQISGMDQFHSKSFVSPKQLQGSFGTCWGFAAVALVESHYLLTHDIGTSPIDIAELGVLFGCSGTECYWNSDHPCDGGATRYLVNWMNNNPVPLEDSDCFPYSHLDGNSVACSCSECDLQYDEDETNDPYDCEYINLNFDFSTSDQENTPTYEEIKEYLWRYGPIAGSFKTGYGGPGDSHVMLIYGYDERNGNSLIVKDTSSHNYQYELFTQDTDPQYIIYLRPAIPDPTCVSEDGDNYKWWGIGSTAFGNDKPFSCSGGFPEPDCFDEISDISQCRFSCNDNGQAWEGPPDVWHDICDWPNCDGRGTLCDPWESCDTCFDDCYIDVGKGSDNPCPGDTRCEEGEDCINSPYDCGPCPECSDRIDNDGDGLIDYQGYTLNGEGRDPGCGSYGDNSEYGEPIDCYTYCYPEVCEGEPCGDNEICCFGDRVNWMSDVDNCGGCGILCGTNQPCIDGQCGNICSDETRFGECKEGSQPLFCTGNEELVQNGVFWRWAGEYPDEYPLYWQKYSDHIDIVGEEEEIVLITAYPEYNQEYLYQDVEGLFLGQTYALTGKAHTWYDETGEYPQYDYPWNVSLYDLEGNLIDEASGKYDFSWVDFSITFTAETESVQIRLYPDGITMDGGLPSDLYNFYDNISIIKEGSEFVNNCQECGCPTGKTCTAAGNCIKTYGGGGPKMEWQNPPPGGGEDGPLNSPEDSFWDWFKCLFGDCPDDDWEPSEG